MRSLICVALGLICGLELVSAFGCSAEHQTKDGNQSTPSSVLTGFAFAWVILHGLLLGYAPTDSPSYSSFDGFNMNGGLAKRAGYYVLIGVGFAVFFIPGVVYLEGYDGRTPVGGALTVSLLVTAAILHCVGYLAYSLAYTEMKVQAQAVTLGTICVASAWTIIPIVLQYGHSNSSQKLAWIGLTSTTQVFMPYLISGALDHGSQMHSVYAQILALVIAASQACLAVLVQYVPCPSGPM